MSNKQDISAKQRAEGYFRKGKKRMYIRRELKKRYSDKTDNAIGCIIGRAAKIVAAEIMVLDLINQDKPNRVIYKVIYSKYKLTYTTIDIIIDRVRKLN